MDNQHRKVSGYRELNQDEIDLMNRIKAANALENTSDHAEYERFCSAEPLRWASIGKTDIQTGLMALVRAVAQPAGV